MGVFPDIIVEGLRVRSYIWKSNCAHEESEEYQA